MDAILFEWIILKNTFFIYLIIIDFMLSASVLSKESRLNNIIK